MTTLRRRDFLLWGGALIVGCFAVTAAAVLPRVVVVSISAPEDQMRSFEEGLGSRGLVHGSTMEFTHLTADGRPDKMSSLVQEAVSLSPDVVVCVGATAGRAVKKATLKIPIVVVTGDIASAGLVKNLSQPEGNVTGYSFFNTDLPAKRLELLLETNPSLRRVKILMFVRPTPTQAPALAVLHESLAGKGVEAEVMRIADVDGLEAAIANTPATLEEAVFVWPSPVFDAHARRIGATLANHRVVAMLPWKAYVEGGGLMSYSPDIVAIWRDASTYVDRILRGAKPSELPVSRPTRFELVINLRSAEALGLTVPESILLRADRIIE